MARTGNIAVAGDFRALKVTGPVTLNGPSTINDAVTYNSTTTFNGPATFNSTTAFNGPATFNSTTTMNSTSSFRILTLIPDTSTATGVKGDIAVEHGNTGTATFLYACVSTNKWVRTTFNASQTFN